jgi:hypothetical protein
VKMTKRDNAWRAKGDADKGSTHEIEKDCMSRSHKSALKQLRSIAMCILSSDHGNLIRLPNYCL